MVTCYCRREFLRTQPSNTSAFVWDINNPNSPLQAITASTAPNCIVYNIKDFHLMVGGIFSGQIALWDPNRAGSKPVAYSDRCFSHRDCVNSIHWLSSKTNTELFSGASDGQVLTWDCRKLSEPIEVLFMDPVKTDEQEIGRAFGISVLEFEQTIPSRFMVGTEQGFCFSCNRKGKSPTEKISLRVMFILCFQYLVSFRLSMAKGKWCGFLTDAVPLRACLLLGEESGLRQDLLDGWRLAGQNLVRGV